MKNPLTPAGIEPATFRFVVQHLNHCGTAVPNNNNNNNNNNYKTNELDTNEIVFLYNIMTSHMLRPLTWRHPHGGSTKDKQLKVLQLYQQLTRCNSYKFY